MLAPLRAAFKRKRDMQQQPAWDRTRLCDALVAWQGWKRSCDEEGETLRDSLVEQVLQFQCDLEQHTPQETGWPHANAGL